MAANSRPIHLLASGALIASVSAGTRAQAEAGFPAGCQDGTCVVICVVICLDPSSPADLEFETRRFPRVSGVCRALLARRSAVL